MNAQLKFIGEIETPFTELEQCPNYTVKNGEKCTIIVYPEFASAMLGLSVSKKILVLYWFDHSNRELLLQEKLYSKDIVGTFTLRSPHRPNPIAASTVEILEIIDNTIVVRGLDCLSGTKLLDIKPHVDE